MLSGQFCQEKVCQKLILYVHKCGREKAQSRELSHLSLFWHACFIFLPLYPHVLFCFAFLVHHKNSSKHTEVCNMKNVKRKSEVWILWRSSAAVKRNQSHNSKGLDCFCFSFIFSGCSNVLWFESAFLYFSSYWCSCLKQMPICAL